MPISTLVAATFPATSTVADLVRQARALKQIYQKTWRMEDLESRIQCYLHAIDLLSASSEGDIPPYASITPAPKASVSEEPLEKEECGYHTCSIGT